MQARGGKYTHTARAPVTEWYYVGAARGALSATEAYAKVVAILDRFHAEVDGLPKVVVAPTAAGGTNLTLHAKLREMEAELEALKASHHACGVYIDPVLAACYSGGDEAIFSQTEQPVHRADKWIKETKRRTKALNGLTAAMAQERIAGYRSLLHAQLAQQQAASRQAKHYRQPDVALGYAYGAFDVGTMVKVVTQAHPTLTTQQQQALAVYLAPDSGLPEYLPTRVTVLSGVLAWGQSVSAFTVTAVDITSTDPAFSVEKQDNCTSIADYMAAARAAAEARDITLGAAQYRQLLQAAVNAMYVANEAKMDIELKAFYESGKWPVCLADAPYGIDKEGAGDNLYGDVLWEIACEQAAKKDWTSDQVEERRVLGQGFQLRPKATGASEARRTSLIKTLQTSLTGNAVYNSFRIKASDRPGEYMVDLVRKTGARDRVCMCPVWQGNGRSRVNRGYVSMRLQPGKSLTLAQARIIVAQAKASGLFAKKPIPPIFAKDPQSFINLYQAVQEVGYQPTVRDEPPYCDWLRQFRLNVEATSADRLAAWDNVERPAMQSEIAADQREMAMLEQQLVAAQRQLTALEAKINGWLEAHKAEAVALGKIEDFAKDIKQLDTLPLYGPAKPHRADVLKVLDGQVGGSCVTDAYDAYQKCRAQVMDLELEQQKFKDRAEGFKKACPRVWESCSAQARRNGSSHDGEALTVV